ncbi:MAG: DMT family transporter [Microcoleaceae cyanobacterium]
MNTTSTSVSNSESNSSLIVSISLLILALFCIAFSSIFIVIAETDLNPTAIALNRLFIAAVAFGLWIKFLPSAPSETETNPTFNIPIFILAGVSLAASQVCSSWSLTQTSVANSALLNNMMPIFTTLGAWLFLGRQFTRKFIMGLIVAIIGVIAIGIDDLHISSNQIMGDEAALLSAILLAVSLLSTEHLRQHYSTIQIMTIIGFIGSLSILPLVIFNGDTLIPTSWAIALAVLALALISQVMGHGLLIYSLKQFSSGLVSVSMLSIPVIAAVLAMILFSQPLTLANGLAFAVVLLGIYIAISARHLDSENKS